MSPATFPGSYRFANVALSPLERRLTVDGRAIGVGGRAFDLLLALIERRDRLVSRDELLDLVWPDTDVEPNNLAVQIAALRKALGPDMIATVPGRGYRFSAVVDEHARAPAPSAPPVPPAGLRTNLPEQSATLIGRDNDLRAVDALIAAHRIVTIVGAGGIGKTRLAQRLLQDRRTGYRHGVCWVELASISDAATLPGAIASAAGINLAGGDPRAVLQAALAPLEILVGLDNAEHLAEDVGRLVEALGAAAGQARFLITSQMPLHLRDEQVIRLEALAVPPASASAAEALRFGAVDLFVTRARAADLRFGFDDSNVASVIRLCEALDGLPLAIEFAAARAPLLGVERVVASLDERLQVLTGGYRSAPARQRTMRATLEWSHQLLGPDERVVFRRLAVVAGSASLDLIQDIVADPDGTPLDRWAVVDALGSLLDRSLVAIVAAERNPDSPRYRLLETPRAYAEEQLAAAGETAALNERHARAVAALFDDAWVERWSGRVGFRDWIDRVEADRENARIAFAWAVRHADVDVVLRIAPVLLTRSLPRGSYDERAAIADVADRWLSTHPPEPAQLPVRLQLMRFWHEREVPRSLCEALRALSLAEAADDRFARYVAQAWLVRIHAQTRDVDAATVALEQMDALEDPAWPPIRLCMGAEAHSVYLLHRGPAASMVEAVRYELKIMRLAGNDGYGSMSNLIDAELTAGDARSAAAHGFALLEELGESRNEFALALARINLAAALLALDDVAQAKPVARAAWQTARFFGLHADCADYLALICALEGRWQAAATLAGYADTLWAKRGLQRWPNEAAAHARAVRLARRGLGDAAFERLVEDGARLSDAGVLLAFEDA